MLSVERKNFTLSHQIFLESCRNFSNSRYWALARLSTYRASKPLELWLRDFDEFAVNPFDYLDITSSSIRQWHSHDRFVCRLVSLPLAADPSACRFRSQNLVSRSWWTKVIAKQGLATCQVPYRYVSLHTPTMVCTKKTGEMQVCMLPMWLHFRGLQCLSGGHVFFGS